MNILRPAVLLSAALLACARPPAAVPIPPSPIVDHSHPPSGPYDGPAEQMAAVVNAQLRVMPDRRFLLAAHDVDLLLTGGSEPVVADFANGRWTIRVGNTDAWSLPDLPTFRDGLDALTAFAKVVRGSAETVALPQSVIARADLDLRNGGLPDILNVVDTIDADAHGKLLDANGTSLLAHAATLMNARTQDAFGVADSERARALALIAITRSLDPTAATADAAAMANICGYSTEAAALAAQLPDGRIPFDPSVLDADVLRYAVEARQLDDFERVIAEHVAKIRSRSISRDIVAAHYRAAFYSYQYQRVHQLDSANETDGFIKSLGPATAGLAPQVAQWIKADLAVRYHGGQGVSPDSVLAGLPDIGADRRGELLISSEKVLGDSPASIRRAAFAFFARCDSRPSTLYPLGLISMYILHDPSRRDRYLAAALARGRNNLEKADAGWIPFVIGDLPALRDVAASADARPEDRAEALLELSKVDGADQQQIGAAFEALFSSTKHGYPIFAEWANKHHEWQRKERVARRWLAASPEGVEGAYYASSVVDALLHQHRNAEALQLAKRYTAINSYNALEATMQALAATGDFDGADDLGQRLMNTYPGTSPRVDYAAVLWQQKRYADAAALLDPKKNELSPNELSTELVTAFNDTFDSAHAADAVDAFAAVVPVLSEDTLTGMIAALRYAGRNDLVFPFAEHLFAIPGHRGTRERLNAFEALRTLKGAPEAGAWLQARVAENDRVALILEAHQIADELVLAYWSPPVTQAKTHEMQLIAAASATRLRLQPADPRRAALVDSLQHDPDTKTKDFFQRTARYLLGLAGEGSLFGPTSTVEGRTSVAYFRGLKAASDGDYDGALPWLLAAEECPDESTWSMNWASAQLGHWNTAPGLSWDEVKRRRVP